jgi:DNA-binding MarR family transcriptional regulator
MDRQALTDRQAKVLAEIARYIEATGEPCRASYLARRLGMTRMGVMSHAFALWRKGLIRSKCSPFRLRTLPLR